eukprot:gnl/MRDRNA2_/MRDRNA2_18594_c0_seq1.p1 gnl/MRDRNA2_/MRDRNA2_18594_c0~~gnl/MRDRNA2_/MRDRNA2_18594_c0_seq1.p1  ORF type:complete len:121 (-),score=26.28 gnl/MRDRNA2_/MRDRNA2_18594_c0_seq1:79-441(-)
MTVARRFFTLQHKRAPHLAFSMRVRPINNVTTPADWRAPITNRSVDKAHTHSRQFGAIGSSLTINLRDSLLNDAKSKTASFTEAAEEFLAMQVKGSTSPKALVQVAQASTAATPWLHVRA